MIKFSTQEFNLLFHENTMDESSCSLNQEDENFYASIKNKLDREVRQPHISTIENILAHSKKLSR